MLAKIDLQSVAPTIAALATPALAAVLVAAAAAAAGCTPAERQATLEGIEIGSDACELIAMACGRTDIAAVCHGTDDAARAARAAMLASNQACAAPADGGPTR